MGEADGQPPEAVVGEEAGVFACPHCREAFYLDTEAVLPAMTDLTISYDVTPGQLMNLDVVGKSLSAFHDLQVAVGDALGSKTEVLLAGMERVGDQWRFTTRIVNSPSKEPA